MKTMELHSQRQELLRKAQLNTAWIHVFSESQLLSQYCPRKTQEAEKLSGKIGTCLREIIEDPRQI